MPQYFTVNEAKIQSKKVVVQKDPNFDFFLIFVFYACLLKKRIFKHYRFFGRLQGSPEWFRSRCSSLSQYDAQITRKTEVIRKLKSKYKNVK